MIKDLIYKNRSYRRFFQEHAVSMETLIGLVDLGRMASSAGNIQPLRYIISCDPIRNEKIFETLGWATYIADWDGPCEGEKPSAYIVMLSGKESPNALIDAGIAVENILLGAVEAGLGGCIFRNIKKEKLIENLGVPMGHEVLMVAAIGRPKEIIKIDPVGEDGNIKYFRDENAVHHVPKRSMDEIILM